MIVPHHGGYFAAPKTVGRFLDWLEQLACSPDLMRYGGLRGLLEAVENAPLIQGAEGRRRCRVSAPPPSCYIRRTMNNHLRTRSLAILALLALLLQVQTVFACEMMEHSEPVAECCCGEMANGQEPDCGCCTLDTRVSLKAEAQEQQPALPGAQFALEPPQPAAPPPNAWPPILAPPARTHFNESSFSPAHPGSRTWLATQRLRI